MYCESLTAQIDADPPYYVTYYLTNEDGCYGIECMIDGKDGPHSCCELSGLTKDGARAEMMVELLARGSVCPENAGEIIEDHYMA